MKMTGSMSCPTSDSRSRMLRVFGGAAVLGGLLSVFGSGSALADGEYGWPCQKRHNSVVLADPVFSLPDEAVVVTGAMPLVIDDIDIEVMDGEFVDAFERYDDDVVILDMDAEAAVVIGPAPDSFARERVSDSGLRDILLADADDRWDDDRYEHGRRGYRDHDDDDDDDWYEHGRREYRDHDDDDDDWYEHGRRRYRDHDDDDDDWYEHGRRGYRDHDDDDRYEYGRRGNREYRDHDDDDYRYEHGRRRYRDHDDDPV